MAAKISKLEGQFRDEQVDAVVVKLSDMFKGIAIHVDGRTRPSAEELKRLMLAHGGVYHHYRTSATTHTIAANLCHATAKRLGGRRRVVRAEWITESIAAGKLLPDHQ